MVSHARGWLAMVYEGKRDLARLAVGGAWLFALGSLLPLLWLMREGASDAAVFRASVGDRAYTIPLLEYSGGVGMLLIWAEVLAVAGAFILSAAPRVPLKLARIGHGVLIAWCALWTLGTWRLGVVAPGFWTMQSLFLSVLFGCTVFRAWKNWRPGRAAFEAGDSARAEGEASNFFQDPPGVEPWLSPSTRKQITSALDQARVAAIGASRKIVVGVKAGVAAAREHNAKV